MTIEDAQLAFSRGELTSRELVESCLERCEQLDHVLGVFVSRRDADALREADAADRARRAKKPLGALHGIPIGVKDVLATRDLPTTAQSCAVPRRWSRRRDAAVVARLRRAGAIVLGKTTTMEFAFGVPDRSQPFPLPRNPWNLAYWAGGSSSGTASGLAAGLFLGGVGTDTGGSIRLPSAFCGVTGLKPTNGLVPTRGSIALAPTLDTVGPMANTARDCLRLLSVMTGAVPEPLELGGLAALRVGVQRAHHLDAPGVDSAAAAAFEEAVDVLAGLGATVVEVAMPHYPELAAASQIVMLREAFAVHRRNLRRRWTGYGVHTRERLLHGLFLTAADEGRARRLLAAGRQTAGHLFAAHDVLVALTAGGDPERIDDLSLRGHAKAASLAFTRIWNGLGLPVASVPIGFTSAGFPVGMQLIGPRGGDGALLEVAAALQDETSWHLARPPLGRIAP